MAHKHDMIEAASPVGAASSFGQAPKRGKRDLALVAMLAGAVALIAALLAPVVISARISHEYQAFKQELAESFSLGERSGSITVDAGEGPVRVEKGQANDLFARIVDAGMGKPDAEAPEKPELRIEFGQGTMLEIWQADIDGAPGAGVGLRYTRADGSSYSYDTDALSYEAIRTALGM